VIYLDTSYVVRLYFDDPGFEVVRQLAATAPVACCILGRAEAASALHRKLREGNLTAAQYRIVTAEFAKDCNAGAFRWLPLSIAVIGSVERVYAKLGATVFLRAADAMHLACAAENRFREIYSNDSHLLASAPHFGVRGVNAIATAKNDFRLGGTCGAENRLYTGSRSKRLLL
jgi:predicted nucleic acid-binding protein